MARRSRLALPRQVGAVRNQIDHWRRTKTRRSSPMPVDLWDAAVVLARAHGVYVIANALGLSYDSLKCRVEMRIEAQTDGVAASTPFVELWPGQPALSTGPVGDSVEITNTAGDKLAVQMAACNRLDVVALAAAFVGRRA